MRTDNEKRADEFDAQLCLLIREAHRWMGPGGVGPTWAAIYRKLVETRPLVLTMTHSEDRPGAQGDR
jgi:hypothetical protein